MVNSGTVKASPWGEGIQVNSTLGVFGFVTGMHWVFSKRNLPSSTFGWKSGYTFNM